MAFPSKPNAQSWTSSNYSADAFLVGLCIFTTVKCILITPKIRELFDLYVNLTPPPFLSIDDNDPTTENRPEKLSYNSLP